MASVSVKDQSLEGHMSGQANEPMSLPAHCLSFADVARELNTDISLGLSSEEAVSQFAKYGMSFSPSTPFSLEHASTPCFVL